MAMVHPIFYMNGRYEVREIQYPLVADVLVAISMDPVRNDY
jgi:hypothetical protein